MDTVTASNRSILAQAVEELRVRLLPSKARRELDRRARKYLHMSGRDFLRAVDRGGLPPSPTVVHLLTLVGRRPPGTNS
jgi:hypothetical protein